jgi:DNA-binding CsgD family transcriptional regulator
VVTLTTCRHVVETMDSGSRSDLYDEPGRAPLPCETAARPALADLSGFALACKDSLGRLDVSISHAEHQGDDELADFFRMVRADSHVLAERARDLLCARLTAAHPRPTRLVWASRSAPQPSPPTADDVATGYALRAVPRAGRPSGDDPWLSLTGAELRVAELVASGMTNREMAEQLTVSHHTVDAHLKHIYAKLGIHSRVELSVLLLQHSTPAPSSR